MMKNIHFSMLDLPCWKNRFEAVFLLLHKGWCNLYIRTAKIMKSVAVMIAIFSKRFIRFPEKINKPT